VHDAVLPLVLDLVEVLLLVEVLAPEGGLGGPLEQLFLPRDLLLEGRRPVGAKAVLERAAANELNHAAEHVVVPADPD